LDKKIHAVPDHQNGPNKNTLEANFSSLDLAEDD
jgi:hypothetical protein